MKKTDSTEAAVKEKYINAMNSSIVGLVDGARKAARSRSGMIPFLLKAAIRQKQAADRRLSWRKRGIHVPPFVIFSITKSCNLSCAGCYSAKFHTGSNELSTGRMGEIIGECDKMGVSIILLAGGEPLVRPEIIDITSRHPDIIFPLFTNGILLKGDILEKIAEQKNVIPVLSLEGGAAVTDNRRGRGVYNDVLTSMDKLKEKSVFFGISITITEENFYHATSEEFIKEYEQRGCGLFFYVEYVPVDESPDLTPLSQAKRAELIDILEERKQAISSLLISFPGDESRFGGCLSSGRGFLHINPSGGVEPCPFSPYSDIDLNLVSFRSALESPLLAKIRNAPERMKEVEGGCALWNNRKWVSSLVKESSGALSELH